MDVCQPTIPGPSPTNSAAHQPQQVSSPFGATSEAGWSEPDGVAPQNKPLPNTLRIGPVAAVAAGVVLAVFVGSVGTARAAWQHITILLSTNASSGATITSAGHPAHRESEGIDLAQLDSMDPQSQAEALLESAVGESEGAVEQISSRLDRWQGKLKWDSQIANLTTAALTSKDLRVRRTGVEVELAAYGLVRNNVSLNYVLHAARSSDHAKKIWALWALGLLANQGVGTPLAVRTLTAHLQDADQDCRQWAVAALALVGSPQVITPLLRAMHDDPSPSVRESAASSLAESGMMTREQRLAAVPQLLNYTEDPALDAQTRNWAFQALACITGQRLPNDPDTWRLWYTAAKVN